MRGAEQQGVVEGRVTGVEGGALVGWIAGALGEGLELEAAAEGEGVFARARAAVGEGGRLGFSIPIPESLLDGRIRFLDVRPAGSAQPLAGGPVIFDGGLFEAPPAPAGGLPLEEAVLPPPLSVEGAVELAAPHVLRGWAFAPDEPERQLRIEVLVRGRFLAAVTADLAREDLAEQGVGDGRHGFLIDLSPLLRRGPHHLTVRVAGIAEPLPGGRLSVGPFPADGEVELPGYLDDEAARAILAAAPFEHLAYEAARVAPSRIVPRLVNRLRRERLALEDRAPGLATLVVLPGADDGDAAALWGLQSHPTVASIDADAGFQAIRRAAREAERLFFARPGDLIHPSAAAIVARPDADVVQWPRFCADERRAGSAGLVLRRPDFDPVTARHGTLTDTTLAVRGSVLAEAPDAILAALAAGRLNPLWFWLAGQGLSWASHPEALTSGLGALASLSRAEVEADEATYRAILAEEGGRFSLERTAEDLPFPYVLAPARRAKTISVLICFRNSAALTLRCLQSIARQRLSGELEAVLVDNRSDPAEARAVVEGARRMLGPERVRLIAYDHPFNHSAQTNLAARAASGEAIVVCNNDVVLEDPALLEQLAAWALHDGIGAVGCRLEDPERAMGSHGMAFMPPTDDPFQPPLAENADPAYAGHVHAVAGNTLALAAVSRERFLTLGGLDETRFPIGYNDMDFMLRASASGLTHLYLGHLLAQHPRGSTRTGDNEDLQALWAAAERPPGAHLRQLVRVRTPEGRTRAPKRAAPAADPSETELRASLEAALGARAEVEAERARIAAMLFAPDPEDHGR